MIFSSYSYIKLFNFSEVIPRLCVRRIVIEDGQLVLNEWRDGSGIAFLLGGRVEFGESIIDALPREMLEETAVPTQVGRLIYFSENVFTSQRGEQYHEYGYYFLVHPERPFCPQDAELPHPDDPQLVIKRVPLTEGGLANVWPLFLRHHLLQDFAEGFANAPRFIYSHDEPETHIESKLFAAAVMQKS